MQFKSTLQWMAVWFLITTSFASGIYSFFVNPPGKLTGNDGTIQWMARIQPIRERLPAATHEVGYLSDIENAASTRQEYLLTQYALIPRAVYQGAEYEWIIGNFTHPGFEDMLDAKIPGEYSVERFGFGIFLIHRISP